ncbi:sensor histidine kinase [Neolewinella persica]|uniref:sensor histidine kinase n=1 Tax=Neolewinella persica TaxID=70998 RepID=UPI0003A46768|nr:histidine kinase [Neolewinella persica]
MPRLFIILLTLLLAGPLSAQLPPLPYAINYGVEDGLPSSEVYVVMEDSRGYMWFGTDNGVARFDGYEFTTYEEAEGLEDLVVYSIKEGPDGQIYACAGKSAQVYVWRENTNRFLPFTGNAALREEALRVNNIHAKIKGVLPGGRLLINLSTAGPLIVSGDGSIEKRYTPNLPWGFTSILENPTIERTGAFFATEADRHRAKQLRSQGVVKTYLKDPFGRVLHQHDFTADNWIPYFNSFTFTTISHDQDTTVVILREGLARVFSINNPAAAREYVVPGKNRGLFKYKLRAEGFLLGFNNGQGLRYYETLTDFLTGGGQTLIDNCNASYVAEDRYGGLWVTTTDRGIFHFPNPAINIYDQRQGYPNAKVISLATIGEKRIAAGYENFNLIVTTENPFGFQSINQKYNTPYKPLTLFFEAFSNQLFSITFHLNLKEKVLRLNGGVKINRYRFYEDTTLLAAGLNGPAHFSTRLRARIPAFTFDFLRDREDFLYANDYRILPNGTHLVASKHGLHRWENYDTLIKDNLGYPELDVRIESIEILSDSSLLFATRGRGLMHLSNDSLTVIGKQEGLASENIRHLTIAPDGTIYASTFSGLSIVRFSDLTPTGSKQPYTVRTYTTAHGLPSNEIHQSASGGGKVWLATSGGLVDFQETPEDSVATPPDIRQLRVNGELISLSEDINLSPDQNDLEITFSTINFAMRGNIPYRYRLHDGEDWKYTKQRTLRLANAAAGDYQFAVQSRNQDGYWSEAASLRFNIGQYWYRTTWFWVLAVAGLLLALYLSLHLRQRRIDRERELKEQAVELERAALRAQMNPHFIFNCLNSINKFILKNEADNASEYLTKFAHLIRQTLNISVRDEHTLYDEINMLKNYLELEKLRFKDRVNYVLTTDPELALHDISIPPLLIQPYVENALAHGLSDDGKSIVKINFDKTENGLSISVQDNGKGIDPTKPHSNKSLGMRLTSQRLALLAQKHFGVELEVSNMNAMEGGGTTVTIFITSTTVYN